MLLLGIKGLFACSCVLYVFVVDCLCVLFLFLCVLYVVCVFFLCVLCSCCVCSYTHVTCCVRGSSPLLCFFYYVGRVLLLCFEALLKPDACFFAED